MGGIIHEPRALWSVQRLTAESRDVPVFSRFNREHFRNGWRHPITLTKMLIAPVGYALREYGGTDGGITSDTLRAAASAAQVCKLFIRSPGRQMFTLDNLLTGTFTPEPVADIGMRGASGAKGQGPSYSPGMLGVSRWMFDKPFELPHDYSLEFKLSGANLQPAGLMDTTAAPKVSAAFLETGAGSDRPGTAFASNARNFSGDMRWRGADYALFEPDGLGATVPDDTVRTQEVWPWRVTPSAYRRAKHGRSGPTKLNGFAIAIDGREWEDAVQLHDDYSGELLASLALRTGCSARVVDAGSQASWWREGAPLALVTPTMTPAQVYDLAHPITLHKGDVLDIEMEIPGGVFWGSEIGVLFPSYQLGVSFTGYAAVEG